MTTYRCDLTVEEMMGSLTGFDEIAIEKAFGTEVLALADHKPLQYVRALIFVDRRRSGRKDTDAFKDAQDLTLDEVNEGYFTPDVEPTPEEPVTDQGKDASLSD